MPVRRLRTRLLLVLLSPIELIAASSVSEEMSMVEKEGISGHVSDYIDSDRIVEKRPDGAHVQVFDIPFEDRYPDCDPGEEHDVVVREPRGEEGWPIAESFGAFNGVEEAVEFAVSKAEDLGLPLWNSIESLE